MLATIFGPDVLVVLVLVGFLLEVVGLVDAISHPEWAWQRSGHSKTLWIVLNIVGFFICGLIIGLIYWIAIRPKVAAAQRNGSTGSWTPPPPPDGTAPAGWYPDPSRPEVMRYWNGSVWTSDTTAAG